MMHNLSHNDGSSNEYISKLISSPESFYVFMESESSEITLGFLTETVLHSGWQEKQYSQQEKLAKFSVIIYKGGDLF